MDQAALVDRDVDAGNRLVQALDRGGFPLVAALWLYVPEEGAWRLLLASPRVSELGPRGAYAIIQDVLRESQIGLPLHRISAVAPDEPLVTELRLFAGTDLAPFIGGMYLQNSVIGETYVEGAYVYRAERIVGKTGTVNLWSVTPDKGRKVWTARRSTVTVVDGFFKKLEVEGFVWPQSHSSDGINAHLGVLTNVEKRGDQTLGDVQRWAILAGRIRGIDTVARGVRVEGYSESTLSTGAASAPAAGPV